MSNQDNRNDWPEAEHRELDSLLADLAQLSPGEGFANAVMARVDIPARAVVPRPSRSMSTRLKWALFGGYSIASATSTAVIIWLASAGTFQIGTLSSEALGFAIAALQAMEIFAQAGISSAANALPLILGGMAALTITSLVSAVGLYRIMTSYSTGRTPINAIR